MLRAVVLISFLVSPGHALSQVRVLVAERIQTGFAFTEGPVWSREGYLLFSDVPSARIMKYSANQPATVWRQFTDRVNGNTFDRQGRLYTCQVGTHRVIRSGKSGQIEILADNWQGKRLNAPNDIVVRADGNIYFTDPAFGDQEKGRELDFFGVYRITPLGKLDLVARPTGRPNGIALSPNQRILYVDNSDERNVRAYDLDTSGRPSNERVIVSDIHGTPDGMKVDSKGNLYVTADAVEIYDPHGKHLATVKLPETPANCAFGDPDLKTLYITARTSLYKVRLLIPGSVSY